MRESTRLLAERADRVSRALESDAISMMRMMLVDPVRYARLTIELDDRDVSQEVFSEEIAATMSAGEFRFLSVMGEQSGVTPGEDLIQLVRWAKHRVVYVVDSDLADAVVDTEWGDTVIPGEVLARLPHPDPMVMLPKPVSWLNTDGLVERYEAFLVLGVRGGRRRCSTHHPDVESFCLHFLGHVVDPVTGRPAETVVPQVYNPQVLRSVAPIVGMRVVTPLRDATMRTRKKLAVLDMVASGPLAMMGFESMAEAQAGMEELTGLGLALLTYLVTDDADVTRARVPASGGKKRRNAPTAGGASESTVVEMGFRVGAALRAAGQTRKARTSPGVGTRTVASHVRRAHLHTFRRGPGRREVFTKWLPPIPVAWKDGAAAATQVHVKGKNGK